jgi:hypothetical protein
MSPDTRPGPWLFHALLALASLLGAILLLGVLATSNASARSSIAVAVFAAFLGVSAGYQYGTSRGWSEIESRVKNPEFFLNESWDESLRLYPRRRYVVAIVFLAISTLGLGSGVILWLLE